MDVYILEICFTATLLTNRRYISPVENLCVAIAALGEGWHNYHHVFPWDYKTSEFGEYKYNITTGFIDTFAKYGWAYDSMDLIFSVRLCFFYLFLFKFTLQESSCHLK